MDPNDIKLEDINKMLIYETQSRLIDELDLNQSKQLAKAYCKLYLQQQEVISNLSKNF